MKASAWPEADALFRHDPRWLGGDAAYSVSLGGDRILWLFGDSFIATDDTRSRRRSVMVRNSVAIQRGADPSAATIGFAWHDGPHSFRREENGEWFWPIGAVRLDGGLLLFWSRQRATTTGLGFEGVSWDATLIDNPDDDPLAWHLRQIAAPPAPRQLFAGNAAQLDGATLVSAAYEEPSHDLYLVRWPAEAASRGDLSSPSWAPSPILRGAATEFSITRSGARFVEVQTVGFGAAELTLRFAPALDGPWAAALNVYHPPEADRSDAFVYAGKAHPELAGARLVATYAANSMSFTTLLDDMSLYYPRFVRLAF